MGIRAVFWPCLSPIYGGGGRWLQIQGVLQDAADVRPVLINPGPIMLADHVPVGMPHLLGDPVPSSQQLARVGVPALTRPSITNPGSAQVSLEEPITHNKVIGVGPAAFAV